MKTIIAIGILVTATAAHAHRPHIIPCSTYSEVAKTATVSRDGAVSLDAAQATLASHHRYDNYYKAYSFLVKDVYQSPELRKADPETAAEAAKVACVHHNQEEIRTRELD